MGKQKTVAHVDDGAAQNCEPDRKQETLPADPVPAGRVQAKGFRVVNEPRREGKGHSRSIERTQEFGAD